MNPAENRIRARGLWPRLETLTAEHFVTPRDVLGIGRTKKTVEARRAWMSYLRETGFSLTEIGELSNRHHTTVMQALG